MFHCLFCNKMLGLASDFHNHLRSHQNEALPQRFFFFKTATDFTFNTWLVLTHLWWHIIAHLDTHLTHPTLLHLLVLFQNRLLVNLLLCHKMFPKHHLFKTPNCSLHQPPLKLYPLQLLAIKWILIQTMPFQSLKIWFLILPSHSNQVFIFFIFFYEILTLFFIALQSNDLLQASNIIYNSKLKILICLTCQLAHPPSHMISHQSNQHKVTIKPQDMELIIKMFDICPSTNVTPPTYPCSPVEGIKIEETALECQKCQYICITKKGMHTHWDSNHLNKALFGFATVEAQKLFDSSSKHRLYFKVDSRLIGIAPEDIFSLFMKNYITQEPLLPSVAPPSNDRDLPLLVKLRGWYTHLHEFCDDSSKRASLLAMASLPEMGKEKAKMLPPGIEKILSKLPKVVTLYMEQIREEQPTASRLTLRSLVSYPPWAKILYCKI